MMMTRLKLKYLLFAACAFGILKIFGIFTHFFEKDFYNDFHYPYDGDVQELVEQLMHQQKPEIAPINFYNYTYLKNCEEKCSDNEGSFIKPRLVYIIKSAISHFSRRLAIRNSWGYEHRFSDVIIRTVFLLGVTEDRSLLNKVNLESEKYHDIVQANFVDTYYNNTIKTMMGFKWAVTYCPLAKFYMFVDDDMYVSTKNVLRFVRNPTNYPAYLKEPIYSIVSSQKNAQKLTRIKRNYGQINNKKSQHDQNNNKLSNFTFQKNRSIRLIENVKNNSKKSGHEIERRQILDFELPDDVRLYSGYVFISSPHRHISSKWHVPLDEYPYHMWPPYVTAGSYIVSREALHQLYYTSFYTKHFRFDDIYLGLVALKANIEPYHCTEFRFYKEPYNIDSYKFIISSHGYDDSDELLQVWNEQRSAGNA